MNMHSPLTPKQSTDVSPSHQTKGDIFEKEEPKILLIDFAPALNNAMRILINLQFLP